jgi:hypothetical protein
MTQAEIYIRDWADRLARHDGATNFSRWPRCPDRMCGADDCPHCHPEHFTRSGYYTGL